jgi:membrane protease YdiL (CAAX protease family)
MRQEQVYTRSAREGRARLGKAVEAEQVFVQGRMVLYFNGIAILAIGFVVAYCAAEIAMHYSDNVAFSLQVGLIALMLLPVAGFAAAKRAKLVGNEFFASPVTPVLSCTAANLFASVVVNLLRGLTGLQLQPAEIYLFYVSIAVAEECTFRLLLVTAVVAILVRSGSTGVKTNAFVASVISGALFSWAHVGVYGNDPIEMASVLVSGFIFSWYFAMTGNPLTCIAAHAINNMIAASFVFTAASILAIII